MSECERILSTGIIPKDFYNEEIICGFFVDTNHKKLWSILLDLFLVLENVCKKHGLRLFSDGGTTLGAIRHNGFIPWDDDLDVCLLREDYDKLMLLSHEFKHPYFLQNPYSDPEYSFSFMRLCNSNTSQEIHPFTHCKYNKGVNIDIFPIDKVTVEDYIPRRNKISNLIAMSSAYMRKNYPWKTDRDVEMLRTLDNDTSPIRIWEEIQKIAVEDERKKTDYCSLLVSVQYDPQKKIWPSRIFDDIVYKDFCSIKMPVPSGWEEQLKIYFGNYMQFPSIEERGKWHKSFIWEDRPYKEVYKEKYDIIF